MTGVRAGGRLVGRDAALAAIGAALADATAGHGGLLLIAGEPGIGKSALLTEQVRRAGAAGVRILRGAGWAGAGAPPYWLWTQVLRGLAEGELPEAAQALGSVGGVPEQARDRFLVFDAVRGALAAVAPVLVALDDLHWADTESLRLLEFLHRTLVAEPVLLLAAYREEEADRTLQALATAAAVLPIPGLDAGGVAALMAAVAGPAPTAELAEVVRSRCNGNPLFVRELTRLMVARGDFSEAVDPLPDGVRDTLSLRLDRLSAPCRDLLELVAVAGPVVTPALLATVGPVDEPAVADLLVEAERARVLARAGDGLRFSHELYRESVLGRAPAKRRAGLHLAVGNALLRLSGDGADPAAVGGAARLAAQFVAGGRGASAQALRWSVLAAEEATTRLGHEDAAGHYANALRLLPADDVRERIALLLRLAASWLCAGDSPAARDVYVRVADLGRRFADPRALAEAALGVAALGARSGTDDPVGIALVEEAVALSPDDVPAAVRSRTHAALARALRHSSYHGLDPRAAPVAARAVELARTSGDTVALAQALHAEHDVAWAPGTTAARLKVLDEMVAAAHTGGQPDLEAEAVLLQAAALIERGDPEGLERLGRYVRLAERLGTAIGRWGALSRRATLAQMTGRVEEAVRLSEEALALGKAIGLPDAFGVYSTLRSSLRAIGGPPPSDAAALPPDDPMWPLLPLLRACVQVQDGDLDGAALSMRGFSVQTIPVKYDLEMVAITAAVLVAVGTREERAWAYDTFLPFAGLHAVVGGCAAYHGVVDHSLGMLAAALGRTEDALGHLESAIALHERLGTTAWARLSGRELARPDDQPTFRLTDGRWLLGFGGRTALVPDVKGMHDIATLLAAPGRPVHVFTLLGREAPGTGADPVLDRRAAAAFRARLDALACEIEDAERAGDAPRFERARAERAAIARELHAAAGLGGRARRLGDETERARKTVTARVRDALRRIQREHPALASHLAQALHTGTQCAYLPDPPPRWRL